MKALEEDLPCLEELRELVTAISKSFGLQPAVVAAVISRESGGGRLLGKNGCPPGTGDRGHGRGLMQIDDRWHKPFLGVPDLWREPAANVAYGCYLLKRNLLALREKSPEASELDRRRAALAAYNCGLSRVLKAIAGGEDVDAYTTGADYSRDVLERAEWLRAKGWE